MLHREDEPLVVLTHLLRWCRDEHELLWEQHNNGFLRFGPEDHAAWPTPGSQRRVDKTLRRAIAELLQTPPATPAVVAARWVATRLDECFWHTFPASFAQRSPYQPRVGDPIPLDSPDVRVLTNMTPTSPPWRLANRMDETRHVRLAGEWAVRFRVVFDYSASDALACLVSPATVLATCHPNRTTAELNEGGPGSGTLFPVVPRDPSRQAHVIEGLVRTACNAGASIIVLPELSTTARIAAELESWVRRDDGPDLVVAGSYHHVTEDTEGGGRRANTAIAWLRGHDQPLTHDKHSPGDLPAAEGIQPQGWPELRVYVGSDGFHLVISICRDLLNPSAVHALIEIGANLVLVPAMSQTLTPFVGSVANLVTSSQALVALSNNPAEWYLDGIGVGVSRPPRALFGHPGLGQLTRLVEPGEAEPGVALMRVASGQLTWLGSPTGPTPRGHRRVSQPRVPRWAKELANAACVSSQDVWNAEPMTNPMGAVLVLLSGSRAEPCVLLTTRSAGLARYPGRVVLPGGLVEPTDDGVAEAALREAEEETGVDPEKLEVLGVMAPMSLPEDGLRVVPVLAWNEEVSTSWSMNYAEVDALAVVPLRVLAGQDPQAVRLRSGEVTGSLLTTPSGDLGDMTRSVLDRLLGAALRTGLLTPRTSSVPAQCR